MNKTVYGFTLGAVLFLHSICMAEGGGTSFGVSPPGFDLSGLPGETIVNTVKIDNPSNKESYFSLKPLGGAAKSSGFTFVPMSSLPADHIARNLVLESTKVAVPAKSYKNVSFSIRIPESAKGTQYAGISLSRSADDKPDDERTGEYQRKISLGMQPGINVRIQLTVTGTVKYSCKIVNIRSFRPSAKQSPIIEATLQNTSNGAITANPILALVDSAGKAGIRLKSSSPVILVPGGRTKITFQSDGRDIPAGTYKGILSISDAKYQIPPSETTVTIQ